MAIVGAVLIASASGAGAQTHAEMASAAYLTCLRDRGAQLDDRTSDARSIGAAIMQLCKDDRIMMWQVGAGVDRNRAIQLMDAARDIDVDRASVVVLQLRAARGNSK